MRKSLQQLVDNYPCFLNIDENIWDPRNNHPDHMGAGCRRNRSSLCLSITAATITNANGCVVVAASDVAPHITVHENYTHDDMLRKSPHGMTRAAILATHMHHLARTDSRARTTGVINRVRISHATSLSNIWYGCGWLDDTVHSVHFCFETNNYDQDKKLI